MDLRYTFYVVSTQVNYASAGRLDALNRLWVSSYFFPMRYPTTSNARYWIVHGGNSTLRTVEQLASGNRWVSVGIFWFDGSPNEYVLLSDITFESSRTRLVVFDAVKWVPR